MASREIEGRSGNVEHVSLNVSKQNDLSSEKSESTVGSRKNLRYESSLENQQSIVEPVPESSSCVTKCNPPPPGQSYVHQEDSLPLGEKPLSGKFHEFERQKELAYLKEKETSEKKLVCGGCSVNLTKGTSPGGKMDVINEPEEVLDPSMPWSESNVKEILKENHKMNEKVRNLTEENEHLHEQLSELRTAKDREISSLRMQLTELGERLLKSEQSHEKAEEDVQFYKEQLTELGERLLISEQSREKAEEDVQFYKEQSETYCQDFEAERADRIKAVEKLTTLKNQLSQPLVKK